MTQELTLLELNLADERDEYVAGIGDINSDAKGSGARYNTGKVDYSLVPITLIAETMIRQHSNTAATNALAYLGAYQATHNVEFLYKMLESLGLEGWSECADVFEYGKSKYAAWNWAKGMPWSAVIASCARHLMDMIDGMMVDNESGKPHRGHVFCNASMLLTYSQIYPEGNDLPKPGVLA